MQIISTSNAPAAIGPYSQAIAHNGTLFVSGQIALDPKTMEMNRGPTAEQTRIVLTNMKAILEAAGSSMDKVIKCTVLMKDMNDFVAMNTVYAEMFGNHKPARAAFEVARLPKDALVEIECIAAV